MTSVHADTGIQQATCPRCLEGITVGALMCKHCKSEFSWRGKLPIGSTALAMTTALIAVLGTVGPKIKDLVFPPISVISAVFINGGDKVAVMASNTGEKAGVITGGTISINAPSDSLKKTAKIKLVFETSSSVIILQPKSTQVVNFSWGDTTISSKLWMNKHMEGRPTEEQLGKDFADGQCVFEVDVLNANGGRSSSSVEFRCGSMDWKKRSS